ncbi:hypothetical protein NY08_5204 [Rhodococcus sp. B7740]|nr:hypothetical protein NY08_5204 [Rhodococcus sp. B7740]
MRRRPDGTARIPGSTTTARRPKIDLLTLAAASGTIASSPVWK